MVKPLKCVQLLSLKQMALRSVAVLFWNDLDVLAAISEFQLFGVDENSPKEWQETVEDKIKQKISKLNLPESLKEQMTDVLEPMGIEIRKWKARYQEYFYELLEDNCLPGSSGLCFTSVGTIDYVKTAEQIVRCDVFLPEQRFKIACLYCLEDHVQFLWEELSEECKEYFSNHKDLSPSLPLCWHHILAGELFRLVDLVKASDGKLATFNQYAFEHAVETGNRTAAQYFFEKLTHEEKQASLMRSTDLLLSEPFEDNFVTKRLSDLLCYLLSVMTAEQQMETIVAHPISVLLCFLDFPLQDLYSENAGLIWSFIVPESYSSLLMKMSIRFSYPGHYVPRLFREFFVQSPPSLKRLFVHHDSEPITYPFNGFLSVFIEYEDSETIRLLFRNFEAADRAKLVFDPQMIPCFSRFIVRGRWRWVEVCLQEATLSEEDRKRMKLHLLESLVRLYPAPIRRLPMWKSFLEFFDGTSEKEEKGELEKFFADRRMLGKAEQPQ